MTAPATFAVNLALFAAGSALTGFGCCAILQPARLGELAVRLVGRNWSQNILKNILTRGSRVSMRFSAIGAVLMGLLFAWEAGRLSHLW
jgi:hypothetical protein